MGQLVKLLCAPGTRDVETYRVVADGDDVMVEVDLSRGHSPRERLDY